VPLVDMVNVSPLVVLVVFSFCGESFVVMIVIVNLIVVSL
jgi:hypothetical protein